MDRGKGGGPLFHTGSHKEGTLAGALVLFCLGGGSAEYAVSAGERL